MASMRVQLQNTKHYWGRILRWNPDKGFKSFPPCYSQSSLYCFLFPQIHATSFSFTVQLLYTVKQKGGKKPDREQYPLPYGFRNPNLKSENSQEYAQKPQRNSGSVPTFVYTDKVPISFLQKLKLNIFLKLSFLVAPFTEE